MSDSTDTRLFDAGERPSPKALFVRDLPDGETVETILLVKESAVAQRRSGEDYLRLKLCDCTGTLEAIAWDGVAEVREIAQPGIALRVRGRYEVSQRYGPQLVLKSASLAQAGDYRLADLMDAPAASAEQMEADLRRLIGTVRNPWLAKLLDALIGEGSPVWKRFRRAPAAKYYHQAYLHGLLEHSLSVGQAVSAVSGSFPGVDRDLAVTGGADPRHREDRGLRVRPGRDRPHRRGQAPGRDPARLLHGAQHDRADRRLSARAGARGAAHRALPPRRAREREPRGAVHPRGDGRARDRQPGRQARVVRPAGEGPPGRRDAGRASTARCRGPRTSGGPPTTPRRCPSRCRKPCPPRRASSRTAQAPARGPPMETGGELRSPGHVDRQGPQARNTRGGPAGRGLRAPRRDLLPQAGPRGAVARLADRRDPGLRRHRGPDRDPAAARVPRPDQRAGAAHQRPRRRRLDREPRRPDRLDPGPGRRAGMQHRGRRARHRLRAGPQRPPVLDRRRRPRRRARS